MKCQSCDQPATIHLTDFVGGAKKMTHLCQECAEKMQLLKNQELNLSAILQTVISHHIGPVTEELSRLTCPTCGIKYMEFKAVGRLGCPQDYGVFRQALEPLLAKIHRSTRHVGKVPPHAMENATRNAELMQLRQQLRQAIDTEAFEDAARLRDVIRQKENADEPR